MHRRASGPKHVDRMKLRLWQSVPRMRRPLAHRFFKRREMTAVHRHARGATEGDCDCECATRTSREACCHRREVKYSVFNVASHLHSTTAVQQGGTRVHLRVATSQSRPSANACFQRFARVSASLLRSVPTCLCGICTPQVSIKFGRLTRIRPVLPFVKSCKFVLLLVVPLWVSFKVVLVP